MNIFTGRENSTDRRRGEFYARRSPADHREHVRVSYAVGGNKIPITEHRALWNDLKTWSNMKFAVLEHDEKFVTIGSENHQGVSLEGSGLSF